MESPPFGEAWIEIPLIAHKYAHMTGRLPSGRRGLKFRRELAGACGLRSPPFGEAWIEIVENSDGTVSKKSPPFGEAWTEIPSTYSICAIVYVASLRGGMD